MYVVVIYWNYVVQCLVDKYVTRIAIPSHTSAFIVDRTEARPLELVKYNAFYFVFGCLVIGGTTQ